MHCFREGPFVPSNDILRLYGKWRPPDQQKALAARRGAHAHHDFFDTWSSRIRDLKEFGVGHMLYFYFLYWMSILFAVLALFIGCPNMAMNYAGRYFQRGAIELTTLGNFGRTSLTHNKDGAENITISGKGYERELHIAAVFLNDSQVAPASYPADKAKEIVAMSVLDMLSTVVYFGCTLALIWYSKKLAAQADTSTVTVHDYSVRVEHLPPDATAQELLAFFEQYGEVVHVELVRAYGELVNLVLQRGNATYELQLAIARLQKEAGEYMEVEAKLEEDVAKWRDKLVTLNEEIKVLQSQADNHRVVGAFVTFKTEGSKAACIRAQPKGFIKRLLLRQEQHKLRDRYALRISGAPEPSDVKYENMEHGWSSRIPRAVLVAVAKYSALVAGFVLISLASTMRISMDRVTGVSARDCEASCSYRDATTSAIQLSTENRELYASCFETGLRPSNIQCSTAEKMCYKCYCFDALSAGMLGETVYCKGVLQIMVVQYTSQVVTVLAILVINTVLSFMSGLLTRFEKHHTRSKEARSLTHKLFLSQFLNSAISTIIANAYIPGLQNALNSTQLKGVFFQGIFPDLTPNWYKTVGTSLVISQFVGVALRVVFIVQKWLQVKYAQRTASQCITQAQLEKSLTGPEFHLDTRYGEHLNVIYVTMLLSGGMPVVYISASVWFLASFWTEKFELLKLSRRPVAYGSDLAMMVADLLPFAVVWHVAFALWAYSIFGVPRSKLVTDGISAFTLRLSTIVGKVWEAVGGYTPDVVAQRLLSQTGAHLALLLAIMAAILLLKLTLTTWIEAGKYLLSLAGLLENKEEQQLTGVPEYLVALRTQLLHGATSYAIQEQEEYAEAFKRDAGEGEVLVQVVLKGAAAAAISKGADPTPTSPAIRNRPAVARSSPVAQRRSSQPERRASQPEPLLGPGEDEPFGLEAPRGPSGLDTSPRQGGPRRLSSREGAYSDEDLGPSRQQERGLNGEGRGEQQQDEEALGAAVLPGMMSDDVKPMTRLKDPRYSSGMTAAQRLSTHGEIPGSRGSDDDGVASTWLGSRASLTPVSQEQQPRQLLSGGTSGQGSDYGAVEAAAGGGSRPASVHSGQPQATPTTAANRLRKARANQVLPVAEQYRGGTPVSYGEDQPGTQ